MTLSSLVGETSFHSRRVLVTGGIGFIGANLAIGLAERHPDWEVVALDNLRRRGSELNLPRLREAGVASSRRCARLEDLLEVGEVDALLECSAEPSVLAGVDGSPDYVVQTNLVGAYNCLEVARRTGAQFVFLSTSRVYPVAGLEALAYPEGESRRELADEQGLPGVSAQGIAESFPLDGARTLYGATKLAGGAPDRGVRSQLWPADRDQSLWGSRRSLADGQGRPGCLHLLDAGPPLSSSAQLHRLRWHRQAGPRPACTSQDLLELVDRAAM